MALPMVLTHKDFGYANLLVDPETSHLTGLIDWSEAKIEPFGITMYKSENLKANFHLKKGFMRYVDYNVLHDAFWQTLSAGCRDWDLETMHSVQSAAMLGLLLSRGFTPRLANMPAPWPIRDDETGAYNMLLLDGLLVKPETKMI